MAAIDYNTLNNVARIVTSKSNFQIGIQKYIIIIYTTNQEQDDKKKESTMLTTLWIKAPNLGILLSWGI